MQTRRIVTIGGTTGVGSLLVSVSMPDILHGQASWWTITLFGLGVACLCFAVLWYWFGGRAGGEGGVSQTMLGANSPTTGGVSVTSYGQTGGMTAHTINTRPEPRTLAGAEGRALIAELGPLPKDPPEGPWALSAVAGDAEAYAFAEQIYQHMAQQGFAVRQGIAAALSFVPITGCKIVPPTEGPLEPTSWRILVGGIEGP